MPKSKITVESLTGLRLIEWEEKEKRRLNKRRKK